jgi:hypothetical protein
MGSPETKARVGSRLIIMVIMVKVVCCWALLGDCTKVTSFGRA